MITLGKLTRAIMKRLGKPEAEARATAQTILSYFGYRNVIIDNAIQPEDRKLFYALQEAGLMRSSLETVLLLNGRSWRIFYWELDEATLDRILVEEPRPGEVPLYKSLPDDAWSHTPASS